MDKAERKRIDQEQWCKELIIRLGKHNEHKARLEVINIMLERSTGPKNKLVASYGDTQGVGLGTVSNLEIEHRELSYEVQLLEAAMKSLSEMGRVIIRAKYIEKLNDWHIIDILIPEKFKKYISKPTYHSYKADALERMGRCLGLTTRLTKI